MPARRRDARVSTRHGSVSYSHERDRRHLAADQPGAPLAALSASADDRVKRPVRPQEEVSARHGHGTPVWLLCACSSRQLVGSVVAALIGRAEERWWQAAACLLAGNTARAECRWRRVLAAGVPLRSGSVLTMS